MTSSNPVLKDTTFQNVRELSGARMTAEGAVMKTVALLFLVICAGAYTWSQVTRGENVGPWMVAGFVGGLISCLATVFKPRWSPISAPIYALCQGLAMGGLSAFFEIKYPGIVLNAIGLTLGVLLIMLASYRLGWLRATPAFTRGVVCATAAIALFYLVTMVSRLFGMQTPMLHDGGLLSIGISLVVVCVAALNLILDFSVIEEGAAQGAPIYMEWYAAFGLVVTLLWLYVEILRLLSKLQKR